MFLAALNVGFSTEYAIRYYIISFKWVNWELHLQSRIQHPATFFLPLAQTAKDNKENIKKSFL